MRQLQRMGWLHHLLRHVVACFLTRGDLWQSWEEGAAVFDKHLVDADWSINNGNWMWLSCSCWSRWATTSSLSGPIFFRTNPTPKLCSSVALKCW
mgnify:CR=1 FL=1